MNSHLKRLLFWISIYVLLAVVVLSVLFITSAQIKEHKLPVGYIQLSTSSNKYYVGDRIIFTITNHLSSTIYLNNNCPDEPLNVYMWQNNSWQPMHYQTDKKFCINQERKITIPEDTSISGDYAYWAELFKQPGKYRLEADVFNYNARPYQEFEIINKPSRSDDKQLLNQSTNPKSLPNQNDNPVVSPTPSSFNDD